VTNGMVIPNHSSQDDYEQMSAIGVTQYGQMTAGSYMYIGPQGIVHGTTITLLNAARKYLGISAEQGLGGVVFVTSGLGGMSGAQAKAAVISGAVAIIAECNEFAAKKRHQQGWLSELHYDVQNLLDRAEQAKLNQEAVSLGYVGNVVELWEALIDRGVCPELGSDQTSLHNPWLGGYMPAGLTYADGIKALKDDPERFRDEVKSSLIRHVNAINTLSDMGMHFSKEPCTNISLPIPMGEDPVEANPPTIKPQLSLPASHINLPNHGPSHHDRFTGYGGVGASSINNEALLPG